MKQKRVGEGKYGFNTENVNDLERWFSNVSIQENRAESMLYGLLAPTLGAPDSVVLSWSLMICISSKFLRSCCYFQDHTENHRPGVFCRMSRRDKNILSPTSTNLYLPRTGYCDLLQTELAIKVRGLKVHSELLCVKG